MAAQEVLLEEPSELPINYKRWILRVSIHCEGCKRKVKKILQQIPGVFEIEFDIKQQKVTVIGDVEADTLLKKLTKAGKHAELWPVKAEEVQKEKIPENPKNKEKIVAQQEINEEKNIKISKNNTDKEPANDPPTVKSAQVQKPSKITQGGGADVSKSTVVGDGAEPKSGGENGGGGSAKVMEGNPKTCGVNQVGREGKVEEKKPENNGPAVAAEKKDGENDSTDGGAGKVSGGNDGGKKKKNKGQNRNYNAGGEQSSAAPAEIRSKNHEDGPPTASVPANDGSPRHPGYYDYPPPHYYGPPEPVYAMSYNTAHPTSYTSSYYAAQPPNSYAYAHSGYSGMQERQPPPPPSDLDSYPRQPLDSFEMFSDENPNGCSVM